MIRRTRRHFHEGVEAELNLLPFMDIFVVLIPMFLTTAVFFPMAALRMQESADAAAAAEPIENALGLAVEFQGDTWLVRANGVLPKSIARYQEGADEELRIALASAMQGRTEEKDVVIVAQQTTRYDDIVHAMDVARATGLSNVALAPSR